MTFLICAALLAVVLPLLLYPLFLGLRATLFPVPVHGNDATPSVGLIICAHNEAASISAKLENALALDYPRDCLEIVVSSDGSTDDTVQIARQFADRGVRVFDLPRRGKAFAIDTAAGSLNTELLAFSDANSEWRVDALRKLVHPFGDPTVGGVAGDQRYKGTGKTTGDTTSGERAYWSFDRILKRWQSRAGNVISATGAIYAVRRCLFEAPPVDATDDFMISTGVIASGQRLVFARDAIAMEPPAQNQTLEFRRKVRVITRGLRAVRYRRALLNPGRFGAYAIELLFHKVLRRMTWIPLLMLVVMSPLCWSRGGGLAAFAVVVAGATVASVACVALPSLARTKPLALLSYGVMVNAACAVATINTLRGRRVSHWEHERSLVESSRSTS